MVFKLNRFHGKGNQYGCNEYGTSSWVNEQDWKLLFGEEKDAPRLVKIQCSVPSPFVIYSTINVWNPGSGIDLGNGVLSMPYESISSKILVGRNASVEVTEVDISGLPIAETITVELPKLNNTYWSEFEKNDVVHTFISDVQTAYVNQINFLFPLNKEPVLGQITHIIPAPTSIESVYRISPDTRIIFENLRTDSERVLDLHQVGGLDDTVRRIRKIIQIPMNHPEYYTRFGIERPKGILLYGPPGNGKTTIAREIAKSLGGASFITVNLTEVWASHVGEGEKILKQKFQEAERIGNCILFIDEIDSIAMIRDDKSAGYEVTLVGTLLSLMDGLNSNSKVFVIGATNRPDAIDPAFRRPGRFDIEEEIPLPKYEARRDILSKFIHIDEESLFDSEINESYVNKLAELTNGYSGADLKGLYREAALSAISRSIDFDEDGKEVIIEEAENCKINLVDFITAKDITTPTSMRGLDNIFGSVRWDDLIALEDIKAQMEELNRKLEYFCKQDAIYKRPSFANILISGDEGTGKETFVIAFAKYFNYEILTIDLLELESYEDISQAFHYIITTFMKLRLVRKVVLIIKNVDSGTGYYDKYIPFIFNQVSKISAHLPSFIFFICKETQYEQHLCGYQKCGIHFNLNLPKDVIINSICAKYGNVELPNTILMRIGEIITYLQEKSIEEEYKNALFT